MYTVATGEDIEELPCPGTPPAVDGWVVPRDQAVAEGEVELTDVIELSAPKLPGGAATIRWAGLDVSEADDPVFRVEVGCGHTPECDITFQIQVFESGANEPLAESNIDPESFDGDTSLAELGLGDAKGGSFDIWLTYWVDTPVLADVALFADPRIVDAADE